MKKVIVIASVLIALLAIASVSLKVKLDESQSSNESYKEQVSHLKSVDYGESVELNKTFLTSFFNFNDTKLRNDDVKPYMTDKAFQIVQSGSSTEVSDIKVKSSAANIKSYEQKVSKTESEFLSEFELTIDFNGVSNTEKVFIRTTLYHVEDVGWKVGNIEYIGELNNELVEGHGVE